jgi:glycosyltransferase involved in cell wall biosynthesis
MLPNQKNMTVLQVLPSLGSGGGVERGTVEIADTIVAAGGRALVASNGGGGEHKIQRVGGEHYLLPLHSKNPVVMYSNIGRLEALIKKESVQIIHARSRAPAWSAYFASLRTGVPFVTTFHGAYSAGNSFKRLYNSVMTKGERVVAISGFIAGHLHQTYGVSSDRIRIIPRGVDIEQFNISSVTAERMTLLSSKWRLEEGLPVVMLPGRLTRWKGQIKLIEAVRKLNRRDIRCLLVGGDQGRVAYRRELENLIDLYGLGEVVRIVDHCDDMPAAYMLSDVVVSASTEPEAFGRIMIEAQALGRPVIASNHGGARETILEGESGWMFPTGDVDALAKILEKAINLSEEERLSLSEKAIAHVSNNFSRKAMGDKTLNVYLEILAERTSN